MENIIVRYNSQGRCAKQTLTMRVGLVHEKNDTREKTNLDHLGQSQKHSAICLTTSGQ